MPRGAKTTQIQDYIRSYVAPETPWDRIASGHPASALLLRLLPLILVVATLPLVYFVPEMDKFAEFALVFLPAFTAMLNGPLATVAATMCVVAVISAGDEALGLLPYPQSTWSDLPPVIAVGVLCTILAWVRTRTIVRLVKMTAVAETVQRAILPELPGSIGGLTVAVAYRTHDGSPGLVGGDFYDVQETDAGIRAVVGDVQGHGLGTVHLTEALLGTFRERALDDPDLPTLAARLERRVRLHNRGKGEWEQSFATAALIEITPRHDTIRVVLCGHPAPLLVRGSAEPIAARPSPPLGLTDFGLQQPVVREAAIMPGDVVVAFTDGLVEGRTADGQSFPLIAMVNAHIASGVRDPGRLHRKLKADFEGGGYLREDDLTILIIQVPPAPSR
ncbi:PP2C family protein-serine/threonine phosphatase [Glycomyces scopariae]|uniref:Stage II sporulation protein E (SpoIIE) n=1 Tax=Glycomyces sambucus TaxID=380244 RepID=A0A1G9EVA9_9ACTN|nr:PP2C family protein-serine/threonine phosphatase [Glycomyces sambucus]SDK80107.1 Stage II sporulation protein E (SpoIIE) [Glycomyces sambucus]